MFSITNIGSILGWNLLMASMNSKIFVRLFFGLFAFIVIETAEDMTGKGAESGDDP